MLDEIPVGPREDFASIPRPCVSLGIIERNIELQVIVIEAPKTFYQVQFLSLIHI